MLAGLPIRQSDRYGSGAYGASRDGGKDVHKGIDLACYPRTKILAVLGGEVTKIGYAYANGVGGVEHPDSFRYVEVTAFEGGYRMRYFYVDPLVKKGQNVSKGEQLGLSQTLQNRYPRITDHVHFEVITREGGHVNPSVFL